MTNFFKIEIQQNRIFGLDILRAAAILFVMITHTNNFMLRDIYFYAKMIYDGVGIFFVLSGFLIGRILIIQLEEHQCNMKNLLHFWMKRWSRTLPNYFLFLFLLIIIEYITNQNFDLHNYLPYFFFSQNLTKKPVDFFTHSWSLSIEEWFYITVPILLFFAIGILKIRIKSAFIFLIILTIIGISFVRLQKVQTIHDYKSFENVTYSVLYRFDSLMYGLLGAYISYYYSEFWNKRKKIAFFIAVFLFVLYYVIDIKESFFVRNFVFTLTSVTILLFLPFLGSLKKNSSIFFKPITYLSLISYSLYLVNSILIKYIEEFINWDKIMAVAKINYSLNIKWTFALLFNFFLSWLLSIVVSILIYKYFEIPTTNYIRKKIV
jgi:peptidoglycan/LPS O-acetylase OafA/YrhL